MFSSLSRSCLERHVIVGVAARRGVRHGRSRRSGRARAVGAAAQHLHVARLDLGGVALLARLLVVPGARLERALDVDEASLGQIALTDARELVARDDRVPLGLFLFLPAGT